VPDTDAPTPSSSEPRLLVVGGGAAGFFGAIAAAETNRAARVHLYEATAHPLAKVRVSGGGRCNTTHACFEPRELVKRYPRGGRELLGPFTRFGPRDTIAWFAARGVTLKTEDDGRMFPDTDDSSTIVAALRGAADKAGVGLYTQMGVRGIDRAPGGGFDVTFTDDSQARFDRVLLATGGNKGSAGLTIASALGHAVEPPVPSLFTFHVADPRLVGLEGLSVPAAATTVPGTKLAETGPVLVTHWGLSGPGILKLSAWGARELAARDYRFPLHVSWTGHSPAQALASLQSWREANPRKQVSTLNPFALPSRLWDRLVASVPGLAPDAQWAGVSKEKLQLLAARVGASAFDVEGKSLNKEEFVTCGGVRLREVDFKTMESRLVPGLHFAGEVLDIDGVTGGFNFQAAWTTGWLAGRAMAGAPG
jgi:predicted Rossmann fold flavoprotein